MRVLLLVAGAVLTSGVGPLQAARFTDTFSTLPSDVDRKPFTWDAFTAGPAEAPGWQVRDGALRYESRGKTALGASFTLESVGMTLTDATPWSVEVGFRHLEGGAPRAEFEEVVYVTWDADAGGMRILGLGYDAANKALVLLNGGRREPPIPTDLSGAFHAVRMTAAAGQVRVYVGGALQAGPIPIAVLAYSQAPGISIGPITSGEVGPLRYEFDYLAFADADFAPGAGDWNPATATEPAATGLTSVAPVFTQLPYPKIRVITRQPGRAAWDAAIPESWRKLQALIAKEPPQISTPLYQYADAQGPSRQNIYRSNMALPYDGKRCVAITELTRGIDDTAEGFLDYKIWYRVSTDGGTTYDAERPLVQAGAEYSPQHPCPWVQIGKNGFVWASTPALLKLSNGKILLPFYYAPLDEKGKYYNPVGGYTFTWVACLIGTWNEAGNDVIWEVSKDIRISGEQSSRGSNECAVIELSTPGHILMVTRGSNAPFTGTQKAWKWLTLSTDYGKTWSDYRQFTYDDGTGFLSPSSCSNFIRSSTTGKVYWIGNISRTRPSGNNPRWPLVIAELDEAKLALRKHTVTIIDDRGPKDGAEFQLSNMSNIEDPQSGNLIVLLDRMGGDPSGKHEYIIEVK
jgi:hypothetical protein